MRKIKSYEFIRLYFNSYHDNSMIRYDTIIYKFIHVKWHETLYVVNHITYSIHINRWIWIFALIGWKSVKILFAHRNFWLINFSIFWYIIYSIILIENQLVIFTEFHIFYIGLVNNSIYSRSLHLHPFLWEIVAFFAALNIKSTQPELLVLLLDKPKYPPILSVTSSAITSLMTSIINSVNVL